MNIMVNLISGRL